VILEPEENNENINNTESFNNAKHVNKKHKETVKELIHWGGWITWRKDSTNPNISYDYERNSRPDYTNIH